jgi:hypothetical protein
MDDSLRRFFLEPSSAPQRQYEALRAVFVEGLSQKTVAQHFGYSYDAFRQLVHEFRQSFADDRSPPFSRRRGAAGRRPRTTTGSPPAPTRPPSPTRAP